MASQITNYQCPACTGPLHFDGAAGKLVCDYCGSSFSVQEIEALYADKVEAAEAAGVQAQAQAAELPPEENPAVQNWGEDAADLRVYNCPSCGAELLCDKTTAATSCPYCGNPTVVPGQFHGIMKPEYVLPFKLDKQAAVAALTNFYKGKKLLPRSFSDKNHIEEIKGVYVPFWLFDGRVDADVRFNAERSRSYVAGKYRVTETDHFRVRRAGTMDFQGIPADGSSKMPDAHMDAIEPFDYGELKAFSTAYLPGYMADIYDVSSKEAFGRAERRACATALSELVSTASGYTSCTPVEQHITMPKHVAHYALLPVWVLSTRWNGQSFLFAMNGQTGKLVGDLPVSKGRYWAWFGGIAGSLAAILAALLYLL
ncbi:MAG: hypothetical protein K6G17_04065 [Oscillospiraceae bacterium]|nr:hypothetical protein [Oscillospiraceae bacterium]